MRVNNTSRELLNKYFEILDTRAKNSSEEKWVQYLDLGTHVVRVINYSKEFVPHMNNHLTYTLKDNMTNYDATLIVWKDKSEFDFDIEMFDETVSKHSPCIHWDNNNKVLMAQNPEAKTYYYAAENLDIEEFIKQGHIFAHTINKIVKTPNSAFVHGAVVGLDNKGILICAAGQRGKSTLAVTAMLDGFDYVSDDYLILSKDKNGLYADPIYSIITLSPRMYNELSDTLKSEFLSNNGRKDKYVLNISAHHDKFAKKYPIKVCLFPQITDDEKPSIVPANKGKAVVQLVYSTINQMGDKTDTKTVKKLMSFIKDFDFYQINLSADIKANVKCLREFTEKI